MIPIPLAFTALVQVKAKEHQLDARLLLAIAQVESGGEGDHTDRGRAYRHEPAFYVKYLAHHPVWGQSDSRRVSASYGHFQVLHVVAAEFGYQGEPEGLYAPSVCAEFACRVLKRRLKWALGADWHQHVGALATPPVAGLRETSGVYTGTCAAVCAYNGGEGLPGGKRGPWPLHQGYLTKVQRAYAAVRA